MRVSVFGLGYVGSVASACLAESGHHVVAVEKNRAKVEQVNRGVSPVREPGLDKLIGCVVASGLLSATDDAVAAVRDSEVSLICVGTPSQPNGDVNLRDLTNVCSEIGAALADIDRFHLVIVNSTVPPGTTLDLVTPTIAATSGKRPGEGFAVCMSPEFLREGSAVNDYRRPARIVIGACKERFTDLAAELWEGFEAPIIRTSTETAEMVKLTDNAWHALKVTFANEIGRISKAFGVDSHAVMDIFIRDEKLNISSRYLQPGFAFGGSCLPKDLRTLDYRGRILGIDTPLIRAVLPSNAIHVEHAAQLVLAQGKRRIGLLGLSFKPDTDDLRESPLVLLARHLLYKGCDLRIFDPNVIPSRLFGVNRNFIERELPQIFGLLVDSREELLAHADVLVVGKDEPEIRIALAEASEDQAIVELVRISESPRRVGSLDGIGW